MIKEGKKICNAYLLICMEAESSNKRPNVNFSDIQSLARNNKISVPIITLPPNKLQADFKLNKLIKDENKLLVFSVKIGLLGK